MSNHAGTLLENANSTVLKAPNNSPLCLTPGYETLLHENNLDSLESLFAVPNSGALSKPGLAAWRQRIRLTLDDGGQQTVVYLKRYSQPPKPVRPMPWIGAGFADPIMRSHAGVEWVRTHQLQKWGVACAEPIAFGAEFDGNREQRSAIVLAAVPGQSLEAWAREWARMGQSPDPTLLHEVATLIGRLHEAGFAHRDLYLSHIFFDPQLPQRHRLHLIDLQRVFRPRMFRGRWRIKDLAALHYSTPGCIVSRAGRLRWLKQYIECTKRGDHVRALAYRVIGKAATIAAHDKRRRSRVQD